MIRVLTIIMALLVPFASAQAQKTTRKGLKSRQTQTADTTIVNAVDTIFSPEDLIGIYSYEKPLASNKESFHVVNNSGNDLVGIIVEILYLDFQGKEIHKRTVDLNCGIPAGATRLLTFPSWDVQKRFYYSEGPKPRKQAYPYTVEIEVIGVMTSRR